MTISLLVTKCNFFFNEGAEPLLLPEEAWSLPAAPPAHPQAPHAAHTLSGAFFAAFSPHKCSEVTRDLAVIILNAVTAVLFLHFLKHLFWGLWFYKAVLMFPMV